MEFRDEKDSMGVVKVREDRLYGAQTQRSLENFVIGTEKMPIEVIINLIEIKRASALVNMEVKYIDENIGNAIVTACDNLLYDLNQGKNLENFPLSVWQTGSGTQSNMNVNEVIAHVGNKILGEKLIHPNDHVNKGQSSNDTFPSAMNMSSFLAIKDNLLKNVEDLIKTFEKLEKKYKKVLKVGRTHLQDAIPLTFAQEISGWKYMLIKTLSSLKGAMERMKCLAIGGTAIGTGLNACSDFGNKVAKKLSQRFGIDFYSSENYFYSLTSKDEFVFVHGAIKAMAMNLFKIANDIRFLSSGPRCGFGEIKIPQNEPGSSIMPGKVNPTQTEAVTMVVSQIAGNDVTISFAASQGNFELNVFMPVIIYNFLQSVRLLGDCIRSFNEKCCIGIEADVEKMEENFEKSLMNITFLTHYIGYEKAAELAKYAYENKLNIKEAVLDKGIFTKDEIEDILKNNLIKEQ